ncbi:MAG: DUF2889 domain-containing protein [Methylocystaceae bacterium]
MISYRKIESYQVEDIPPLGYRVLGEWIDDVHHIKLDICFDFATQSIVEARAWAEKAPFAICSQGFEAVRQLIGTRVGAGFGRLVRQTLESPQGCLHVGELVLGSVKAALQASSRSVPEWAEESEYELRWRQWEGMYKNKCIYFAGETLDRQQIQDNVVNQPTKE